MTAPLAICCTGEEATLRLGRALAAGLSAGTVVALYGELGTGKTVLCRGIAQGLGIVEAVTSPTFTVVQEYRRPDGSYLFHLDLYRIRDAAAGLAFGVEEYLFAADGIALVEWPERIADLLVAPGPGRPLFEIRLGYGCGDARQVQVPCELGQHVRPLLGLCGSGVTQGAEEQR
jgi:tRNA threonylcarbamoyladenosine biosynthesis protein TsaE